MSVDLPVPDGPEKTMGRLLPMGAMLANVRSRMSGVWTKAVRDRRSDRDLSMQR